VGLWRIVRGELGGTWRSARYDVHRRLAVRRALRLASAETTELPGAAVTMAAPRRRRPATRRPYGEPPRPRRMVASTGVALLVAGGAAGTYLAVAGTLTALTRVPPVPSAGGPAPQPVVATEAHRLPASTAGRRVPAAPARPIRGTSAEPAANPVLPAPTTAGAPTTEGSPAATSSETPSPSPSAPPSSSPEPSPSVSASSSASYGGGQTRDGR
jgi:hypothetical protein